MKNIRVSLLAGLAGFQFVALLALSACGGKISGGPCEGANPPSECGSACVNDVECGFGLHCGGNNVCTAECTSTGGECGSGQTCDDTGRCTTNGPDGGVFIDAVPCPNVNVDLTPIVPTVMLVVDKSGSMTGAFGNTNRWDAVHTALTDPVIGAVTNLESSVLFGAALYSAATNSCPDMAYSAGTPPGVPLINNRNAIEALFAANGPGGRTPTHMAIDAVVPLLVSVADPASPQIIVLATDGQPNLCTTGSAEAETVAAVQNAFNQAQPIETYVLFVGAADTPTLAHLAEVANAGLGLPLNTPNPVYYVADNPAALEAAFAAIIGSARTCTFTLGGTVIGDGSNGTVTLDTGNGPMTLVLGTDWLLTSPTTIELIGAACTDYLTSVTAIFDASFPCGAIVP